MIKIKIVITLFILVLAISLIAFKPFKQSTENHFLIYKLDPKKQNLQLFWKNENGDIYKSIQHLKTDVESKNENLVFAMNGGMYNKDCYPQGLFIQNKKTIIPLDTNTGKGNFYLMPNGVFYLTTNNDAVVCKTKQFKDNGNIKFATQSGPMLVVDGKINTEFKRGSSNLNIRNGVGVLPNNTIVFAMSKHDINFYDFATYFKSIGCKNALYLDGFVSRAYLPEKKWLQTDGNFGVIIGVTINAKK